MIRTLEVFADVTCPFTHVGLRIVTAELSQRADADVIVDVRAWPLEWVNGTPLAADAPKIEALRSQLDLDLFNGFRPDRWPTTSIPALNLAAAAYEVDHRQGLDVSLDLRRRLFEFGEDISDPATLAAIARDHNLAPPSIPPDDRVTRDYQDGTRRGVRGSPDFWVGDDDYFCPSLALDHDADGSLLAHFDESGLRRLVERVLT